MKEHFNQRAEGAGTPHFSLIDRIVAQDLPYIQEGHARIPALGVAGRRYAPDAGTIADLVRIGATPLSFYEVSGHEGAACFRNSIVRAMQKNAFGKAVEIKPVEKYEHLRMFLSENGDAGFAIDTDGSIVSVFRAPDAPIAKASVPIMVLALQCGGDRLDAFDTVLPVLYSRMGFRVVARIAWNPDMEPTGWNKDSFRDYKAGEPDVVFMVFDPGHGQLYVPGDGAYVGAWDDGVALQNACLAQPARRAPAWKGKPDAPSPAPK